MVSDGCADLPARREATSELEEKESRGANKKFQVPLDTPSSWVVIAPDIGRRIACASNSAHVERMEQRMRSDGGGLGPRERVRLDRALDRSSAHVYHARHDAQSR